MDGGDCDRTILCKNFELRWRIEQIKFTWQNAIAQSKPIPLELDLCP
jgi:hypothetical protein